MLRYNDVARKHVHNSYERKESVFDQALYYMVRSFELDLHPAPEKERDWLVYHRSRRRIGGAIDRLGRTAEPPTCKLLSECLKMIAAVRGPIPNHEVITVFLELKKGDKIFDADNHRPEHLDAQISEAVGGDEYLLRPGHLLQRCPAAGSLKEAVTGDDNSCRWPLLSDLRGKFAFVFAGQKELRSYTGSVVFQPGEIFFGGSSGDASSKERQGLVSRVTKENDREGWNRAIRNGAHFLGTDRVNFHKRGWSRTHNGMGWPFCVLSKTGGRYNCSQVSGSPSLKESRVFGVEVFSGHIGGQNDAFFLLFRDVSIPPPKRGAIRLSTLVSVADSHVPEKARGCLVARASLESDSPYFAVCRMANKGATRVYFRKTRGGDPKREDLSCDQRSCGENRMASLQLTLTQRSECVEAGGAGALPGQPFSASETACFKAPLRLVGLAASGHDARGARILFGDTRVQIGRHEETLALDDFRQVLVRDEHRKVEGDAHAGVFWERSD